MTDKADQLRTLATERILIKDGAYGTQVQEFKLDEAGFRGGRAFMRDQKGNNDLLNLTRPEITSDICNRFVEAGADILATNTFNANRISQSDYGTEDMTAEINLAAAKLTREAADTASAKDGKPRFVAGAIGPTNKTLSLSPDVNDPGFREVDFDGVKQIYVEQIAALVDGGVDFILIETVFDTLNAKSAIMAALEEGERRGRVLPLMLSMTITDMAGRNLSGHSIEAFWAAVRHAKPLTVGLNCSFGADRLRPHMAALSAIADTLVMGYPNAGLPNELGEYDECADKTREKVGKWVEQGLVNIVGGCCGTTPDHIAALADLVNGKPPRAIPDPIDRTFLAGIEPMTLAA
ncbi:MAG: 5-methyltetrahydrofolate--homocysteine methyltransferase [Sphingomonadaceae bacterium]|nr:5-methyltetrahydrofolate--homocysteine methyltransferase [Sphingomonadaceae bacterium]